MEKCKKFSSLVRMNLSIIPQLMDKFLILCHFERDRIYYLIDKSSHNVQHPSLSIENIYNP